MALNTYKVLGQQSSGTYAMLPISSVSLTSNFATITTAAVEHGMQAGDLFDINATSQSILNIRGVAAATPTPDSFQFLRTNGNIGSTAQTGAYVYAYKNNLGQIIIGKEKTNGMALITTVVSHNLSVGDWVTVWVNDTNFDGDFVVYDIPDATSFRYIKVGSNVTTTAISPSTAAAAVQKAMSLYTVPAASSAVCSTLVVSNNLTHSGYFSAYIVKSGDSTTSPPDKSIVFNRIAVDPGESYNATLGYTLAAGDRVVVRASHAGMHFNLFGSQLS
jgi:hypothetical protein